MFYKVSSRFARNANRKNGRPNWERRDLWFLSPHSEVGENASNRYARQKNDRKEYEYRRMERVNRTESIGYQHGPILDTSSGENKSQ